MSRRLRTRFHGDHRKLAWNPAGLRRDSGARPKPVAVFEPVLKAATKNLGDAVEIRIRDNGTGIPPEVRDKIFNPFFTTKPAGEAHRAWALDEP